MGLGWFFFSDLLLTSLLTDQIMINRIQLYQGWAFVILTAIAFYRVIQRPMRELREKNLILRENYERVTFANREIFCLNLGLEDSNQQVNKLIYHLETLIELVAELSRLDSSDQYIFLSKLLDTAVQIIPEADYGCIYVHKEGQVRFINAIGHDLSRLNKLSVAEDIFANTGKEVVVIGEDTPNNSELLRDQQLVKKIREVTVPTKETMLLGLYDNNKQKIAGISLDIDKESDKAFNDKSIRTIKAFKSLASAFYTITRYNNIQNKFQSEVILSLLELLEIHDFYTRGHSQNVATLTREIAKEMKLSEKGVRNAYWAGLIHDIGKTLIPDSILNKKSDLSAEEFENIQKHPLWGYQILKNSQELKELARYVLYHHERWDGKGYPEGLKKDKIPLISQIISVADGWDAMRSKRAYRDALSYNIAIKEIEENSGRQFSPVAAKALLNVLRVNKSFEHKYYS